MARDHKKEPGLLSHLDKLMGELNDNVPKAVKEFDADAIHDARVATRRLKAAMGLLESVLLEDRRKTFEKVLKKIRRRLGPLRDMDVMIEHLGKLETHPTHGPAAVWLRDHLKEAREKERTKSHDRAASADVLSKLGAWWHVREQIADAAEAIDTLLAQSLHLQLDSFAERAGGLAAGPESQSDARPRQDPHELRIAGKLLRYTLEVAQAQGHNLPATILRQFKAMQESLGNWHDYIVLMQCTMQTSLDEMLALHDLAMQERLLEMNRYLLRQAGRELGHFGKLWQQRGEAVSRTIRDKFPLTRSVSEPKTDPDPTGSSDTPAPAEPPQGVPSDA
jgi:CHAD domain-containing protein